MSLVNTAARRVNIGRCCGSGRAEDGRPGCRDALRCKGMLCLLPAALGPRLSPPGAMGARQGWPHPGRLLPNPAKRLGPQCPGNATSKTCSWWLWGIGVPSKGALSAPVLPLASRELQQVEALLGTALGMGRKRSAAVALRCWTPPAANTAAPSSILPNHVKCPIPRVWQVMDMIYSATSSTV